MKFLYLLIGIVGVTIGAFLLAIGDENTTFQAKFLYKLCGALIFVGTIYLVQKRWK